MQNLTNHPTGPALTDIELPTIIDTWVINGLKLCVISRPSECSQAKKDAFMAMDEIVTCAQSAIDVPVEDRNDTIRIFHQLAAFLPAALAIRGFVEVKELISPPSHGNEETLFFWLPNYNFG